MRITGMLLLLIVASTGLYADEAALPQAATLAEPSAAPVLETACDLTGGPSNRTEPLLSPGLFEPAQESTCNCDVQCGVCGGRLRGCYNGIAFCECFHC